MSSFRAIIRGALVGNDKEEVDRSLNLGTFSMFLWRSWEQTWRIISG